MTSTQTICRFAPSPNGLLHLGHAYSALLNRRLADRAGGRMLLRMENIDLARCGESLEAAIRDDLTWLGIGWDCPVLRQSDRFAAYTAALEDLRGRGLLYPCFCTRGDIAGALAGRADWPRDPDGSPLYPGTCRVIGMAEQRRRMAEGCPFCLRLDMAAATQASGAAPLGWTEYRQNDQPIRIVARPEAWGDAVLRRKDIPTSYHLSVVLDDAEQAVTDVVRGEDLLAATSLHRRLQALLGLPEPAYHHHGLILEPGGQKLSKSHKARPLADYRARDVTPDTIKRLIGLG